MEKHIKRGKQFGSQKQIGVKLPIELVAFLEQESNRRNLTVSAIVRECIEFLAFRFLWRGRANRLAGYLKDENILELPRLIQYEEDGGIKSKLPKDSPILQLLQSMEEEMNDGIEFIKESLEFHEDILKEMERKRAAIYKAKAEFVGEIVKIVEDISNLK